MRVIFYIMALSWLGLNHISAQSTMFNSSDIAVSDNDPTPSTKDTTDYKTLYREEIKRKDSLSKELKTVEDRKKALQSYIDKENKNQEKKRHERDSKIEKLNSIERKMQDSRLPELLKKRHQLHVSIEKLKADTIALANDIATIEKEIERHRTDMKNLENVKDSVGEQIIAEYKSYLELPFSEMTRDSLSSIKERCRQYPIDKNINTFLDRTTKILDYKTTFDEATEVVNSKFNKSKVDKTSGKLGNTMEINTAQKEEINSLRKQLRDFEPGIEVFRDFITELNRRRTGISNYTQDDYKDDKDYIMTTNNIQDRIMSYIQPVPYLNKKFKEYIESIGTRLETHSEIETEILDLQ